MSKRMLRFFLLTSSVYAVIVIYLMYDPNLSPIFNPGVWYDTPLLVAAILWFPFTIAVVRLHVRERAKTSKPSQ